MIKKSKSKAPAANGVMANPTTLATVLAALEQPRGLSTTRLRDVRSAVKRVADLLGEEPGSIPLDLRAIGAKLGTISPVAAGITSKRFGNVKSDFLAGVKASGLLAVEVQVKKTLSPAWRELFKRLSGRRAHIGLSRVAGFASAQGIEPADINDEIIEGLIAAVREGSLHKNPKALHRQTTLIWNEAARDRKLGLRPVTVASFRGPPQRIEWSVLPVSFRRDTDDYLHWLGQSDPFAPEARPRALAPTTLRVRRAYIHAAVSALVETGPKPANIRSLADLVRPSNLKAILRRRLEIAGGKENAFNRDLGIMLALLAREWVKVDGSVLTELKRLVGKLPVPIMGLTAKNRRFLRQFNDTKALRRLVELPERLWAEVRREKNPSFHVLPKAQAALAIAILTFMPVRPRNLSNLSFDTHLFVRAGADAISTLELSASEVKNNIELAFDIPPHLAKMLIEYRERIAPKVVGHRPTRLFVNADGTPKSQATVAWLISTYAKRRTGIVLTPHQFRHLSAKVLLDAQPGCFESVRQLLGHKRRSTAIDAYAGFDCRRAGLHHQRLIEGAMASQNQARHRQSRHERLS